MIRRLRKARWISSSRTANEEQIWATAMVVKDGKFITVGRITKTKLPIGDYTKVVDFDGQLPCAG